jgi:hypothetical protein
VLVAEIGSGRGDFLAWFRPETLREVTWGGDPYSPKIVEDERGLLERRGASLDDGLAALLAAADGLRDAAPQELCDGVLAELAPPDTDDVTPVGIGLR